MAEDGLIRKFIYYIRIVLHNEIDKISIISYILVVIRDKNFNES